MTPGRPVPTGTADHSPDTNAPENTMKPQPIVEDMEQEVRELLRITLLVETNDGTYGALEAGRKVGCSDPQFATRNVYETVGGVRSSTGPDPDRAPGYMRPINRDRMAQLREQPTGRPGYFAHTQESRHDLCRAQSPL